MDPIPGARWALPDREWGLAIAADSLALLERKAGVATWSTVMTRPLPELVEQIEAWIRDVVVPWLQRALDTLFPPVAAPVVPPVTVAGGVESALRRGAVQYVSSHRKFGYVAPDPGNV